MMGRGTLLPVGLAVVIGALTLVAVTTERSNAPTVAGDATYPHYVCTFTEYCAGSECTREPVSFVAYLSHVNAQPRLELLGVNPQATLEETPAGLVFTSNAGPLSGSLEIQPNRNFNWVGSTGSDDTYEDHFGTGKCERLKGE